MVGRYIDSFDEEPLPVDVASRAYQRLVSVVDDAELSMAAPALQAGADLEQGRGDRAILSGAPD